MFFIFVATLIELFLLLSGLDKFIISLSDYFLVPSPRKVSLYKHSSDLSAVTRLSNHLSSNMTYCKFYARKNNCNKLRFYEQAFASWTVSSFNNSAQHFHLKKSDLVNKKGKAKARSEKNDESVET